MIFLPQNVWKILRVNSGFIITFVEVKKSRWISRTHLIIDEISGKLFLKVIFEWQIFWLDDFFIKLTLWFINDNSSISDNWQYCSEIYISHEKNWHRLTHLGNGKEWQWIDERTLQHQSHTSSWSLPSGCPRRHFSRPNLDTSVWEEWTTKTVKNLSSQSCHL